MEWSLQCTEACHPGMPVSSSSTAKECGNVCILSLGQESIEDGGREDFEEEVPLRGRETE